MYIYIYILYYYIIKVPAVEVYPHSTATVSRPAAIFPVWVWDPGNTGPLGFGPSAAPHCNSRTETFFWRVVPRSKALKWFWSRFVTKLRSRFWSRFVNKNVLIFTIFDDSWWIFDDIWWLAGLTSGLACFFRFHQRPESASVSERAAFVYIYIYIYIYILLYN